MIIIFTRFISKRTQDEKNKKDIKKKGTVIGIMLFTISIVLSVVIGVVLPQKELVVTSQITSPIHQILLILLGICMISCSFGCVHFTYSSRRLTKYKVTIDLQKPEIKIRLRSKHKIKPLQKRTNFDHLAKRYQPNKNNYDHITLTRKGKSFL